MTEMEFHSKPEHEEENEVAKIELSVPAFESTPEVLAANSIDLMIAKGEEYTPTPAVSHAILAYNRDRDSGLADGIVITPSRKY